MANSAADARGSEQEIRKQLLQKHTVVVMVSIAPNFFYTVTLPCTLWFLDRGKANTPRKDEVPFVDARHIFRLEKSLAHILQALYWTDNRATTKPARPGARTLDWVAVRGPETSRTGRQHRKP